MADGLIIPIEPVLNDAQIYAQIEALFRKVDKLAVGAANLPNGGVSSLPAIGLADDLANLVKQIDNLKRSITTNKTPLTDSQNAQYVALQGARRSVTGAVAERFDPAEAAKFNTQVTAAARGRATSLVRAGEEELRLIRQREAEQRAEVQAAKEAARAERQRAEFARRSAAENPATFKDLSKNQVRNDIVDARNYAKDRLLADAVTSEAELSDAGVVAFDTVPPRKKGYTYAKPGTGSARAGQRIATYVPDWSNPNFTPGEGILADFNRGNSSLRNTPYIDNRGGQNPARIVESARESGPSIYKDMSDEQIYERLFRLAEGAQETRRSARFDSVRTGPGDPTGAGASYVQEYLEGLYGPDVARHVLPAAISGNVAQGSREVLGAVNLARRAELAQNPAPPPAEENGPRTGAQVAQRRADEVRFNREAAQVNESEEHLAQSNRDKVRARRASLDEQRTVANLPEFDGQPLLNDPREAARAKAAAADQIRSEEQKAEAADQALRNAYVPPGGGGRNRPPPFGGGGGPFQPGEGDQEGFNDAVGGARDALKQQKTSTLHSLLLEETLSQEYPELIAAIGELAAVRRRNAAEETAVTQKLLAGDELYLAATAEAANAKRVSAALIKQQELLGLGIPGLNASVPDVGALQKIEGENAAGGKLDKARQSIEEQRVLGLQENIKVIAEDTAIKKANSAQEKALVEEALATNGQYIAATAEAANLRRQTAAQIKAQQLAGVGLAPGGLAAVEQQEAANSVTARIAKARATVAENELLMQESNLQALSEERASTRQLSKLQKAQGAVLERALFQRDVASGAQGPGSFVQQLQARIATRSTGEFKNPNDFQNIQQLITGSALTTAKFAVSGVATYAIFNGFQKLISDSADLERHLQQIKAQFAALGESGNFAGFRSGILEISRDTGAAAGEVAEIATRFKGAFGRDLDNTQVLDQTRAAVELSRVTGLSLKDITNNLTGAAVAYHTTARGIGDVALTLQDRTGVAAREIIQSISDVAAVAQDVGLTIEQAGSIAAVAAKYTGQAGSSIAEGLNRILPAVASKTGEVIQLFQQARPQDAGAITEALATGQSGKAFDLIGKAYDGLNRSQKNYLITLLGSRRDAKTAIDIFQNYGEVIENVGAAQNSSGRLAQSYSDLQETLTQQLNRLVAVFKSMGAELLNLGLSDFIQESAKALGVLATVVADVVSVIGQLNDLMGGFPAKAAAVLIAIKALGAAGGLVGSVGFLGAGRRAAGFIPGVPRAGERAAAGNQTFRRDDGVFVAGAAGSTTRLAESESIVVRNLQSFGGTIATKAAEQGKIISTVGRTMGGALQSLGTALETFAPIIAIFAVGAVLNKVSSERKKVAAARDDYRSGLEALPYEELIKTQRQGDGFGADARNKVLGGSGIGNALQHIPGVGGVADDVVGFFTHSKTPDQVRNDVIQKTESDAQAKALIDRLSKEDRAKLLKGSGISEDDLKTIAAGGTDKDSTFNALQGIVDQAEKNHQGVAEAIELNLKQQGVDKEKAAELSKQLSDLPTLQIQVGLNQITPESFASQATVVRDNLVDALNIAIANNAPIDTINSLKTQLDAVNSALDQTYGKYLTDLAAAKNQIGSLKGQSSVKTRESEVRAAVESLRRPNAITSSVAPKLAQDVIKAQQEQLDFLITNAKSGKEALRLYKEGIKLPPEAVQAIQAGDLTSGYLPEPIQHALDRSALELHKNFATVLQDIVTAKGGIKKGVEKLIRELRDEADKLLEVGGAKNERQAERNLNTAQNLETYLGSGGFDELAGISRLFKSKPDAATPQQKQAAFYDLAATQNQDPLAVAKIHQDKAANDLKNALPNSPEYLSAVQAQAAADKEFQTAVESNEQSRVALIQSMANGDPIKVAEGAIASASLQIQQAAGKGEAAQNAAQAAMNSAQQQYRDAVASISQAYAGVLAAAADGDPVKAAQASLLAAQLQAQNAHGEAERLNALAAEISAQHALRDALNAVSDAQKNIVLATLEAAGKTVAAAKEQQKIDKEAYQRYLAQHPGATKENNAEAAGLYQKTITDAAATRDATLEDAVGDINFGLATHKIFNSQAIARLKALDANQKLTKAQHQQLEEQIYSLQHESQQDLQFNLPTDIKLPTLYEARRFNEGGAGGQSYTDNRNIEIHITANNKATAQDIANHVKDAVNGSPRYGARPRTY